MRRARGLGVSPGVAIGRAFVYDPAIHILQRKVAPQRVDREFERLERALSSAREELTAITARIESKLGPETAGIFSFQLFVLQDPEFLTETSRLVKEQRLSAESAVHRFLRGMVKRLASLDPTLSQRGKDFRDLEQRIVRLLQGRATSDLSDCPEGAIVIGPDLTPSQTVTLDKRNVAGFVTELGGHTSHTAILAKNLGIPAVVGAGRLLHQVSDGDIVVVDGTRGIVVLRPNAKTRDEFTKRRQSFVRFEEKLVRELRDRPPETRDGYRVELLGNIEFPDEIAQALSFGASGIGLYRTEFLFLGAETLPDEDAQVEAYGRAIEALGGRPLVIRTMDLGADKELQAADTPAGGATTALFGRRPTERNPFLGCRSIRLSLREPEVFRTQLRAILRAAVVGDVRIMLPMISSLGELSAAKSELELARSELEARGVPFRGDLPLGIMIEVPSAVMIADLLAREVDFFSIGTNDLIQYTLAVDRVNQQIADLYQPAHPAILRMIRKLIDVGEEASIPVSMCGEMSGNVAYSVLLAGLGLREFSVGPASIPEIKKVLRSVSMKEARQLARRALSFTDGAETEAYLASFAKRIIPEAFGEFSRGTERAVEDGR